MKFPTKSGLALLMLSAMVAACGGASAASTSATQGQAGGPAQASAPAGSTAATGSTTATVSTAAINACAVITEQDATTLLGSDPGAGQDTTSDMGPACAYGASLTLNVAPGAGKAQFDTDKASAQGSGKSQDLTGVGDAAFVFIVANTIGQMEILKGSTILTINVQGDPSLQNITPDALTTLGKAAAGRI
jgi:hypothetical protein